MSYLNRSLGGLGVVLALLSGCGSGSSSDANSPAGPARSLPTRDVSIEIDAQLTVPGDATYSIYQSGTDTQPNVLAISGGQGAADFVSLSLPQTDAFPIQREVILVDPRVARQGAVLNAHFRGKEWMSILGNVSITSLNNQTVAGEFQSQLFNMADESETLTVTGRFSGKLTFECWVLFDPSNPIDGNIPPTSDDQSGQNESWQKDADLKSAFCQAAAGAL